MSTYASILSRSPDGHHLEEQELWCPDTRSEGKDHKD